MDSLQNMYKKQWSICTQLLFQKRKKIQSKPQFTAPIIHQLVGTIVDKVSDMRFVSHTHSVSRMFVANDDIINVRLAIKTVGYLCKFIVTPEALIFWVINVPEPMKVRAAENAECVQSSALKPVVEPEDAVCAWVVLLHG